MTKFIGRQTELKGLNELLKKRTASLVVIRGRRRIGKTRLAEEFAKSFKNSYQFSGLPPSRIGSAQAQRDEFRRQLKAQGINPLGANDWGDFFLILSKEFQTGRVLLVLDEITWMGSKDPEFLGKL